jgi:hypothetical protein
LPIGTKTAYSASIFCTRSSSGKEEISSIPP